MNRKTLHALPFPGTNHDVLTNFQHLVELYNLEAGHLVKCSSCQKFLVGGDISTVSNYDSSPVQIHPIENVSHQQAENNRSSRKVDTILDFSSRMNRGKLLVPFSQIVKCICQ